MAVGPGRENHVPAWLESCEGVPSWCNRMLQGQGLGGWEKEEDASALLSFHTRSRRDLDPRGLITRCPDGCKSRGRLRALSSRRTFAEAVAQLTPNFCGDFAGSRPPTLS